MPSQRWLHPTLALLCALTLLVPLAAADEAKAELEPKALQALEQMGRYLRSLRQFGIEAQSSTDQVLEDGQTLEFRHRTELLAQRPDKLRVSVEAQGARRSLYYDGTYFTLYESRSGYFTRAPAPAQHRAVAGSIERTLWHRVAPGRSVPLERRHRAPGGPQLGPGDWQ